MFNVFIIHGFQCSVNFLLYIQRVDPVTHTCVDSSEVSDTVPSAIQQDLIAHPFQRQQSVSINPNRTCPLRGHLEPLGGGYPLQELDGARVGGPNPGHLVEPQGLPRL